MGGVEEGIEIAKLIIEATSELGRIIYEAFKTGDMSKLSRPVSEILPPVLKTTLAKREADLAAEKKFGPHP